MEKYIMTIDEGTTSARAVVFDHNGEIVSVSQNEFNQYYPKPGWLEQNPIEIWTTTLEVMRRAMGRVNLTADQIMAIGITNQRETSVVWDRKTGDPVYRDIVWGDRRTAGHCDWLKENGYEQMIKEKTGLVVDPEFSAGKIMWILDNVEGARERAEAGELVFGNIDTWILWNLTGGKVHATDPSNASRTSLYNIHTLEWDDELLKLFNIPKSMCPEVRDSGGDFGVTNTPEAFGGAAVPITGILGDQMAATFGQCCFNKGEGKMTFGTAGVFDVNCGDEPVDSKSGLLTTIGWKIGDEIQYLLEGVVFNAGSTIQWLRDELDCIEESADSEYFAKKSQLPLGTVYFVPCFSGLGAPNWDAYARGMIMGMSRGATKNDIIRAALDSLGYQTRDMVDSVGSDLGEPMKVLCIDGGAAHNNLMSQFVADINGIDVERPTNVETTAAGAAYIAGLQVGYWKNMDEIIAARKVDKVFKPEMDAKQRERLYAGWLNCLNAIMTWSKGEKELLAQD